MRRLVFVLSTSILIGIFTLDSAGCRREPRRADPEATEDPGEMASMLYAADPRASAQLVRGFYDVEQNAWRWTSGSFAVKLRPPRGADQKGAHLVLKFVIPDIVIARLRSVTLSSSVEGVQLEPETYRASGDEIYARDVPAAALRRDAVTVEFALDKAMPPSPQDARELGVIMNTVGFEAKP